MTEEICTGKEKVKVVIDSPIGELLLFNKRYKVSIRLCLILNNLMT